MSVISHLSPRIRIPRDISAEKAIKDASKTVVPEPTMETEAADLSKKEDTTMMTAAKLRESQKAASTTALLVKTEAAIEEVTEVVLVPLEDITPKSVVRLEITRARPAVEVP